jgi:hypothetical protein
MLRLSERGWGMLSILGGCWFGNFRRSVPAAGSLTEQFDGGGAEVVEAEK